MGGRGGGGLASLKLVPGDQPQAADRHADVPRPLTHAALPRRFRAAARGGKMGA